MESSSVYLLNRIIIRHGQRKDLPGLEWNGEYRHFRRLYQEVYASVESGDALIWVAEYLTHEIVGQLFVQFWSNRPELADGWHRAYIYGFRIRPEYRGFGLGTKMLSMVESDLIGRGFQKMVLNVSRENQAALALYERLGFQVVADEPGKWSYIDDGGFRRWVDEPAWRMEKKLA